jgi:hypothetical protein
MGGCTRNGNVPINMKRRPVEGKVNWGVPPNELTVPYEYNQIWQIGYAPGDDRPRAVLI